MKDGVVNQVDSPLNLYNYPVNKFVAGFIGSPSMNFISGKLVKDNGLKFINDANNFSINLSQDKPAYNNYADKKVVLGRNNFV